MSYDLDKLGTVLAVANQMNRDMLEMYVVRTVSRAIRLVPPSSNLMIMGRLF